ncbi:tripartite ATP-independent transporter DctP family solute receptor [Rhodobium orientis]|uniref:C4-dicarboxylate ABC transporter substrate-binding protein n=1 Tax=Rhodobium orientis TaxID=34017 RepID=A0A327JX69_9HYPH|nr:TRAP transporter substrate-binding protein [Rhodobium orientis]MBB4301037.1 tripartite ATP-independent transporter DctP family solute receptor [Rhodobium orientis]MBK5949705.1 C4-dicarboxylate ABC transporter substrate-binding protein [Rhodobium orientis]RAI30175.1 C4-dicarboxylate ABC transporter substrate-binding protein [Rhodobium orientis]
MNSMIRTTAAALLLVSTVVGAGAAEVTMNVGWSTPLDSQYGILAKKFEELAETYSDGAIDVKLHCCGQIASEDDAFRAMQLGTVDAYFVSQNNISPHWPLMDVFVLPYMFQNTEHLVKVADGPIGDQIREQIRKDTGVHLLTFGGPSYRDFFNSVRPINTIEDMDGLKIRVPKNEVMLATFEAFGAEPVPLAWSETPTALQTGTIDGGDNGTSVIKEMKFYEFAKHLVILDHFASFTPLLASDRFMGKLDDAQREAVLRAAKEAGEYHTEITLQQTEEIRNWLVTEGGMEMTRPERAPFIKAAQKVQQEFAAKRGEAFTDLVNAIQAAAE